MQRLFCGGSSVPWEAHVRYQSVNRESLLTCAIAVSYNLTKTLTRVLSLPLVLHHSLAPSLKRVKQRDPDSHKYDSVPPEVAFTAASVIVLKMVYGLDGTSRYDMYCLAWLFIR